MISCSFLWGDKYPLLPKASSSSFPSPKPLWPLWGGKEGWGVWKMWFGEMGGVQEGRDLGWFVPVPSPCSRWCCFPEALSWVKTAASSMGKTVEQLLAVSSMCIVCCGGSVDNNSQTLLPTRLTYLWRWRKENFKLFLFLALSAWKHFFIFPSLT